MTDHSRHAWLAAGSCVSADPDLFFPVSASGASATQIAQARRICARCPVRRPCLDFATETSQPDGIWGGTTPEERARARRQETAWRRDAGSDVA